MFDNLPIRRIKNLIASFLIIMSLVFMWYVYTDDISYIAKQQSDNYKSDVIEFGGSFKDTGSNGNSVMQFKEEIEVEDVVEEEVEEVVYKNIDVSIWNFIKFGLCTLLFGFVVTFLCVSKGQNEPILDTFKKGLNKVLIVVVTLILTIGLTTIYCIHIVSYVSELNKEGEKQVKDEAKIKFDGVYKLEDGKNKKYKGTYKSIVSDESVFIVGDGASIDISQAVVDKSGIDCFNNIYSKNYGMNAAILAIEKGKADVKSSNIYSDANGGTGLFATGKDAYISGKNTKVIVLGNASAYGAATSYEGKIELEQMDMITNGKECAVLMAGRSGGEISILDSSLKTYGECAPIAHVRGNALLKNITGESKESYICSVEDGGSIQIDNSNFMAGMIGYSRDDDGFVVVKSDSSDYEDRKPAIVTINNTVLQSRFDSKVYSTAPAFVVSNAEANINIKNTELKIGSKILFDIKAINGIGRVGRNGGHASVIADSQKLVGFIKVDEDSSLNLKLTNGTGFVGGINYLNSGSEKVELSLDSSSAMILTTHCYLTKFENEDETNSNIRFGRYKIFVNGKAIN